ncbi:unnamed protein product [Rhizophagus irregularis]|nr:unnamed protein product [Rhizophagus irregularis]
MGNHEIKNMPLIFRVRNARRLPIRNSKTVKLQSEKAKDIEETENTYSDEGLNVSNDIFVEGPEYLEVNI